MQELEIQQITNFQDGLIKDGAVAETQMPLSAVSDSVNIHYNSIGRAKVRKGITIVGSTLGSDILGLYEFRDSGTGTNNRLVAVAGTKLYYWSGSAWTEKRTSLTANSPARFTSFLDFLWMVNGTESTAIWTGAAADSFLTTGNASSAPTGQYIETFRSRVWIAGNSTYPDRVYYSSTPSKESTPVVTWDTSATTGDWIDISPQDGDNITGLKRSKNTLLVFKRNHLYRIASIDETEPDPKFYVGTYSNESIVECKDAVYFHHPTGIYVYADGGIAKISQPIVDFIDNMSTTDYANVSAWTDGECVYFSLGSITIDSIVYSNTVAAYNVNTKAWAIHTYPTQFYFGIRYLGGTKEQQVVGGENGSVYVFNSGNTDNGSDIFFSLTTRPYTFDGLYTTEKTINLMSVLHEKMEGAFLSYKADTDDKNKWTQVAQLDKTADLVKQEIKGNKIWFRISGTNNGTQPSLYGFEILKISSELKE